MSTMSAVHQETCIIIPNEHFTEMPDFPVTTSTGGEGGGEKENAPALNGGEEFVARGDGVVRGSGAADAYTYCQEAGCTFRTTRRGGIRQHMMFVHNVGKLLRDQANLLLVVVFFARSAWPTLGIKSKVTTAHPHQHQHPSALVPPCPPSPQTGVTWLPCDFEGCSYRAKQKCNLLRHKRNIHGSDVKWFTCDKPGCKFKSKEQWPLKRHNRDVHNIDVVWHYCDMEGCSYRTKQGESIYARTRRRVPMDSSICAFSLLC